MQSDTRTLLLVKLQDERLAPCKPASRTSLALPNANWRNPMQAINVAAEVVSRDGMDAYVSRRQVTKALEYP